MLSFTTAGDKLYGVFAVPSYTLQFAGRNAAEMRQSLSGAGKLEIGQGRVAATAFSSLAAEVAIGRQRLDASSIVMESPVLRSAGRGTIGFDQVMHFDLDTQVSGGLARTVNKLSRRPENEQANLPVVVTGAVSAPRVRPNVGRLASGVAQDLIQSLFGKKQPK